MNPLVWIGCFVSREMNRGRKLSFILLLKFPSFQTASLFVSLVYCAESTIRWFVVREKHCWMAADSADKSKRTGRAFLETFSKGMDSYEFPMKFL
jgi:hypothetical protein